jgi:hypothetical protein
MAAVAFGSNLPTWEERDFTTVPSDERSLAPTNQCFDSQAAMDTCDTLAWMNGPKEPSDDIYNSVPNMYQTGPFTLSDLSGMEPDATPSGRTSQSTSRSHSYSMPESGQTGQPSLHSSIENICPLLAGQSSECTPQLCGPSAACLEFANMAEIEDCTSVPCITQESSDSPTGTQTNNPAALSNSDTGTRCSSTSHVKKPMRNSQQRLQRTNPNEADTKSYSKKAHSLVERRYRENLNNNIAELHLALLETKRLGRFAPQSQADDPEERRQALSKVRKGDVLLDAVNYVHQTEVELRHMADEISLLSNRVRQLEKLVKCEDCALMKQLVSCNLSS